jgi:hypothetical protein
MILFKVLKSSLVDGGDLQMTKMLTDERQLKFGKWYFV